MRIYKMFKHKTIVLAVILVFITYGSCAANWVDNINALKKFFREGGRQFLEEPEDRAHLMDKYDFIIVGAGTAGCVLANRLTEIPHWKVLLIEAGDRENYVMDIPLSTTYLQFTEANWGHQTIPLKDSCRAMKEQRSKWPRGKVMGGSSVINYMIYIRGNRRDFDNWESLGNTGWGWKNVLSYYKKIENYKVPENNNSYYGTNGQVSVENAGFVTEAAKAWVKASGQAGHRLNHHNGPTQPGAALLHFSLINGTRHSSNRAYLHPIRNRPNLHVIKKSHVTKILINNSNRARGVEFVKNRKTYRIMATKEVILSAGAINSPQVLMLSGIGPKEHLEDLSIKVYKDLNVGYNLMDHIGVGALSFTVNSPDFTISTPNILNNISHVFRWLHNHTGILGIPGASEAVTFVDLKNPQDEDGWPDMEIIFLSGSIKTEPAFKDNFGFRDDIYDTVLTDLMGKNSFTMVPVLLRPKSRGRLTLKNANPFSHPLIDPKYFADDEDMKTLIAGVREAIKITQQDALRAYEAKMADRPFPECVRFGFDTDAYWDCYIRYFSVTFYHPAGTCKMGPASDPGAVVDPRLRVYGVKGLRVADSSIIPQITAGHLNAPTFMIGEKTADMIKEDWRESKISDEWM